jgi:hypothetical protein
MNEVCPICGGADEELGSCGDCDARMCVTCWQFNHICPPGGV